MGHVSWAGLRQLTKVVTGIQIPQRHKYAFCFGCVMAKCKQAPYRNMGIRPTRPKETFGGDVTVLILLHHPILLIAWKLFVSIQDMDTLFH